MFSQNSLYAIVLVTIILRLVYVISLDDDLVWYDAKNYHSLAINLASGNGFESTYNPFSTSSWAPLFPYFVAFWYWLFVPHIVVIRIVHALLGGVLSVIIYQIGNNFFNKKVGSISCALFAFHPIFIYVTGSFYPVIIFSLIFSLVIFFISKIILNDAEGKKSCWYMLLLIGFLLGMAALAIPAVIFFFPFIPIGFLVLKKFSLLRTLKYSAAIFTAMLLTLVPWTLKNYLKYDKIYFITEEGGHSFYATNVPWFDMDKNITAEPPLEIKEKMAGLSKKEQDKFLTNEAIKFIKNSPGQYLKLYLQKALRFWQISPTTISTNRDTSTKNRTISILFYGIVFPFAWLGMIISLKNWRKYFYYYAAIFSFNFGYSFFITSIRYRLPVEPFIIFFAAIALVKSAEKISEKVAPKIGI